MNRFLSSEIFELQANSKKRFLLPLFPPSSLLSLSIPISFVHQLLPIYSDELGRSSSSVISAESRTSLTEKSSNPEAVVHDKSPENSLEKTSEQTSDQTLEKTAEKTSEKSDEPSLGQLSKKTSELSLASEDSFGSRNRKSDSFHDSEEEVSWEKIETIALKSENHEAHEGVQQVIFLELKTRLIKC